MEINKGELEREELIKCLICLNDLLKKDNIIINLWMCGGAALSIYHNVGRVTEDVDAYFDICEDTLQIYIDEVSEIYKVPKNWLNNGIEGLVDINLITIEDDLLNLSNIHIKYPSELNMLIMKLLAGRPKDEQDIKYLMDRLGIKNKFILEAFLLKHEDIFEDMTNRSKYTLNKIIKERWGT